MNRTAVVITWLIFIGLMIIAATRPATFEECIDADPTDTGCLKCEQQFKP
jgi:hypothetical protein